MQNRAAEKLLSARQDLAEGQVSAMMRRWFVEDKGTTESYQWETSNQSVCEWLEQQMADNNSIMNQNILAVKKDAQINLIKESLDVS